MDDEEYTRMLEKLGSGDLADEELLLVLDLIRRLKPPDESSSE